MSALPIIEHDDLGSSIVTIHSASMYTRCQLEAAVVCASGVHTTLVGFPGCFAATSKLLCDVAC